MTIKTKRKFYAILCKLGTTPEQAINPKVGHTFEQMGSDGFITGEYVSLRNFWRYAFNAEETQKLIAHGRIWRVYYSKADWDNNKATGLYYRWEAVQTALKEKK